MAHSLSTDSFLNVFRRFLARRGTVKQIYSDNGTNLVAGNRELKSALREWNDSTINTWMIQRDIDWSFQPPHASHFGGFFERMIRTIRKTFQSILKEQPLRLNDDHLNTLMCEVESILNCRPLTEVICDTDYLEPLTPNHLLLLNSGATFPPGLYNKNENYHSRRWKQVQYLSNLFWQRWRRQYIPLLQERQKWLSKGYTYRINDIVLLTDELLPRNQWSLGRIVEVYPDKKGVVRVVKLVVAKCRKNKNSTNTQGFTVLQRPVNKLVLIMSSS